ncbi:alpha/beta hydrolase [Streptomyces sp. 8N706]|uniref:alpha/beta hydrolase n=1 Tax=Streptomyces sp. 8N706 TaxID=3457416 RepID=UPI003FCFD4AF
MRAASRLRRGLLVAVAAGSIVLSVSAATRSGMPGTPPAPRLAAVSADTLEARYAANRDYITESERAARHMGDTARAQHLGGLRAQGRQFLSFSTDGDGLAVEVIGDLAHADRVAVVVPGSDTTIDTFDRLGTRYASLNGGARALYAQMRRTAPDTEVAVVAWLGYHAPRTMSRDVVTTARAEEGGRQLRKLVERVRDANPTASAALLCHSYGSVVCGSAIAGSPGRIPALSGIAVFGSPGMGVRSVSELHSEVPVWAGRGTDDWIREVPNTEVSLLGRTIGFGTDPTSRQFGARHFAAGSGGHSDYLRSGTLALRNLSLIALGRGAEVSHD